VLFGYNQSMAFRNRETIVNNEGMIVLPEDSGWVYVAERAVSGHVY